MTTAPWHESVPSLLPGTLAQTASAQVLVAGEDPIDLEVEGGSVTFDDSWSPHVQANVICRVPESQATLDLIDPRKGAQVLFRAGYILPGGRDDTHDLALLELRSRPVSRPANTVNLDADSAECRVQDYNLMGATLTYPTGTTNVAVITGVLNSTIGASAAVTIPAVDVLAADLTVSTAADLWNTIHDHADRASGWLYVDAAGMWHLDQWPTTVGLSSHIMATGPGGNISRSESVLDTGEWGNAVVLDYGSGNYGYAKATAGPFSVTTVPRKVIKISRAGVTPGTQGARDDAAAEALRRVLSRGRGFTLTGPSAYWLRPGQTITARLPSGPQERHLVSRVSFDLKTGAMTVRTRVPDTSTTITPGA